MIWLFDNSYVNTDSIAMQRYLHFYCHIQKKKTIGKSYKCKAGHVSLCRFMINLAPLYCQRKEVCIQRCAFSVGRTGRDFGGDRE